MEFNPKESKTYSIMDYLFVLFKWKRFFFINIFIVLALTTTIVFLLKVDYKATAVIMLPEDGSSGLGNLGSLIGGKNSAISMGAKLMGISGASEDMVFGLLNSRTALLNVIDKFELQNYYEVSDNKDKLLKAFRGDISFDPNEFGMIEINVINQSADTASLIANYFVELIDSLNIKINSEQAKNNRIFLEGRYRKNIDDLKLAEDSMFRFQKKYGIFAVPEQLEVAVKAAAEVESELTAKEIASHFAELQFGKNSPQHKMVLEEAKILKDKVLELKNSEKISGATNVFFPFSQIPMMTLQYYRIYREIEIQSAIMEIILPMYEQAKVEEQKSIPTIMVIDHAVPPELKNSPKRLFIIVGVGFLFTFFFITIIYIAEASTKQTNFSNQLSEKSFYFFSRLGKIYGIK